MNAGLNLFRCFLCKLLVIFFPYDERQLMIGCQLNLELYPPDYYGNQPNAIHNLEAHPDEQHITTSTLECTAIAMVYENGYLGSIEGLQQMVTRDRVRTAT
jgi:hypothetical protein